MRENKQLEYKQQITGNLGGYWGVAGIPQSEMKSKMLALITEVRDSLSSDVQPLLSKTEQSSSSSMKIALLNSQGLKR